MKKEVWKRKVIYNGEILWESPWTEKQSDIKTPWDQLKERHGSSVIDKVTISFHRKIKTV